MKQSTKIFTALDMDRADEALALVRMLRDTDAGFKIGKQLFTAAGPDIVKAVVDTGKDVFLDLKFHDIPNTVARAGRAAADLGVAMFNVHAGGGRRMMRALRDEFGNGEHVPALIAVTVLTSMDDDDLHEIGVSARADEQVIRLAKLARSSGMDGVVASPLEVRAIRESVDGPFRIVTPGVRPASSAAGDQKRISTPAAALRSGSDHLVIGRPIREADDPRGAYERIVESISHG